MGVIRVLGRGECKGVIRNGEQERWGETSVQPDYSGSVPVIRDLGFNPRPLEG